MTELAISGTLAAAVAVLVFCALRLRDRAVLPVPQTRNQPTTTVKSTRSRDGMIDQLATRPRVEATAARAAANDASLRKRSGKRRQADREGWAAAPE